MPTTPSVILFNSRSGWTQLSCFAMLPIRINVEGQHMTFRSLEHAYQYLRTTDPSWRKRVWLAPTARDAKAVAKAIARAGADRPGWDDQKAGVMERLWRVRLRHHPAQRAMLLTSGDAELVHACPWERVSFWGVGSHGGANTLGCILMLLRDELRAQAGLGPAHL